MSLNTILESSKNLYFEDMTDIENNVSKLTIIIIFIDNYNIEKTIKDKIKIEKDIFTSDKIKKYLNEKLNETEIKDKYKLDYILNFIIKKDQDYLNNLENIEKIKTDSKDSKDSKDSNYELQIIKNIENIDYKISKFKRMNSFILILNKINKKYYIKKKK